MKKLLSVTLASAALVLAGCSSSPSASASASSASSAASVVETSSVAEEPVSSVVETEPVETEETVMTYEEYAAASVDEPVTIECYVQAKQSWWDNSVNVYAQDEDGGYFIYGMECSEDDYAKLTEGTKIRVNGYKGEWSGEVEVVDATFEIIDGNYVADAVDVTDLLGKDELVEHQNQKVAFKGLTVEAFANGEAYQYNWDGSGSQGDDLYFNVSLDGETYSFTVESYLCDKDTDVYKAVEALKVGDVVDLEGFLYWYEGPNPHITSVTVK